MTCRPTNTNLTAEALHEARLLLELNLKRCTTCFQHKELEDFPTATKSLGGVGSACKICTSRAEKEWRDTAKSGLMFQVNRAILKKQRHGTHVCWLVDKSAHQAAAHLLGDYGLLSDGDSRKARALFMNNLPDRLHKLSERAETILASKELRVLHTAAKTADRDAEKEAARLARKTRSMPDVSELTDGVIESLLYTRLRHHLKKKRRTLKTSFSFTKPNFHEITGYKIDELREHLAKHIPIGKTWIDVLTSELHIEHIIPAAAFDLTTLQGVRNCYAISNLTLLSADDNQNKGATFDKSSVSHFRNDIESAKLFGLVE